MKRLARIISMCFAVILVLGSVQSFAASYKSYTYSIKGEQLASPDGFSPDRLVDSNYMGLKTPLNEPTDIVVDEEGNVYIADPNNNRIVILDKYYKLIYELTSFVNDQGVNDTLRGAKGLCVTGDKIYVADTGAQRILVFNKYDYATGKCAFVSRFEEPVSDSFDEDDVYMPVAIAADKAGRMYVVSATTYEGIIALDVDGTFSGFVGAQKVTYNAFQLFWRKFQTQEQRDKSVSYISTEYNNITIDEDGFVYATTSSIEEEKQQSAIEGKSKTGDYAPVRKYNSAGDDIMRRNGFYPPSGEVKVRSENMAKEGEANGASTIVDAAIGVEGTWSIVDQKRSRIFTYDINGELLFAFGDVGTQLGNLKNCVAIEYQGEKLLALDTVMNAFTVYSRTDYGDTLIEAIAANNDRRYDEAADYWKAILQRNNNFDAAYVGLGKAAYRSGDWDGAMDYFKYCYDTTDYSEAFKMKRKSWVEKWVIVIPIFIVALCIGLVKFFGYAAKTNKRVATSGEKKSFGKHILYAFHLMLHPFDGFWDLKHEKRGSVGGAIFWLGLAILAFAYNGIGQSYIFNPTASTDSLLVQIASVIVPVVLWCAANWCLTTLMEGEGSFADIFKATCYSLVPIPLLMIPSTILTHVLAENEAGFISLINGIMWVWVGLLIFFGCMITHDYSLGKNVITCIGTIVGMAVIMFLGILFSTLVTKMIMFVSNIITEISYRV